MFVLGFVCYN